MPQQVTRLLIAFAIFISIFLLAKSFLTPKSFGEFGHYRGDAIREIASMNIKYVDRETCTKCHIEKADSLAHFEHKNINCQTCHGPGYKHNQWHEAHPVPLLASTSKQLDSLGTSIGIPSPEEFKMVTSDMREFCLKCHAMNAARPEKIIQQIDVTDHYNPKKKCISCHSPHAPSL